MNGSKSGVIAGLVGLGVGSALMYWYDPTNGRRRRTHARNTTRRAVRRAQKVIDTTSYTLRKLSKMELGDAARYLMPETARAWIGR